MQALFFTGISRKDPLGMDEHRMRVWGGWAALAFGSLMLIRAYVDYRRTRNPQALRVGLFLFGLGVVLLLAAVFRLL